MRYRLLGPLEVIGDDGSSVTLAGGRERVLLATLVLGANQVVSTDRLVDALWGEEPPATAANALQVHVSKLRKKLAEAGAGDVITRAAQGYVLQTGPGDVDLDEFEQLVGAAAADPAGVSKNLGKALALWQGPALADVSSDLLAGEKTRLEEFRLLALEKRIDADLALGRHAELVGELEGLVQADPLREGPRRQLMLALYRSGRQADALATYREAREFLAEELGIDPGAELQALELAILNQDPDIGAPPDRAAVLATALPPSGTLTLLITDVEGSTRLWEEHSESMAMALRRHDELVRGAIEESGGYVFKAVGDGFCATFPTAGDAVTAAAKAQRELRAEAWPSPVEIRVRMAVHTGSCEERDGDYFGPTVNRTARLNTTAHGGQVVVSNVTRELLGEIVALRDLGLHRLKDLSQPEHIFQLVIPGLETEFPPLRSLDNPELDNNLPIQLTSFVGRQREVAEVCDLVEANRLVTLTGAGGAGKTRLALAVAAELIDGSRDGVWFVDLAPLTDSHLVPGVVAAALGVRDEPGHPIVDTLLETLRLRRLLIVLDNCEHLIDACVKLIDQLLNWCPDIHVLATSREALALGGERLYRVPPLALPKDGDGVRSSEAVSLFVERARDQQPEFLLDDANAGVVAELCRRLDGMPLAIELACARLRSMALENIQTRLDQRFRLLTGGSRTALPRQQTLHALIDWSYDLLSEPERVVLERLSVFAGSFDLGAAEAVVETEEIDAFDVGEILGSLVDKSLVQPEYSPTGLRYGLLETIRAYASERLASRPGDAERDVSSAHAHYFLGFAANAATHLHGHDQLEWLDRLDAEHDNLRVAMDTLGGDASPDGALRLAVALGWFWDIRHPREGSETLAELLERTARSDVDRLLLGSALIVMSRVTLDRGARPHLDQALTIADEVHSIELRAEALTLYAWEATQTGDLKTVDAVSDEALDLSRKTGDGHLVARALVCKAWADIDHLRLPEARTHLTEALHLTRESGDRNEEGLVHGNLGVTEMYAKNYADAEEHWRDCLVIGEELGDSDRKFQVHLNLAVIQLMRGNQSEAREHLLLAMSHVETTTSRSLTYALLSTSLWAARANAYEEAAALLGASDVARNSLEIRWEDVDAELRDEVISQLHSSMGDAFERAIQAGRRLNATDAVELGLNVLRSVPDV